MRTVTGKRNSDVFMENPTICVKRTKSWLFSCAIVSRVYIVHSLCRGARCNFIKAKCESVTQATFRGGKESESAWGECQLGIMTL